MCLIVIVEDVSTAIFIKCGKIFVISLPSLKDIYVVLFFFFLPAVRHMPDALADVAAINFKRKNHTYLNSEPLIPVSLDRCSRPCGKAWCTHSCVHILIS